MGGQSWVEPHWKQEAQSPKSLTPKKAMAHKPRQDLIDEPIVREVRECVDSAGTSQTDSWAGKFCPQVVARPHDADAE